MVSKHSEIWSGLFIPDPYLGSRSWFFTHPGSRGQKSTGSRIRDTEADLVDVEPVSPAHEEPRILHHLVRPSPFQTMRSLTYRKNLVFLLQHTGTYCLYVHACWEKCDGYPRELNIWLLIYQWTCRMDGSGLVQCLEPWSRIMTRISIKMNIRIRIQIKKTNPHNIRIRIRIKKTNPHGKSTIRIRGIPSNNQNLWSSTKANFQCQTILNRQFEGLVPYVKK